MKTKSYLQFFVVLFTFATHFVQAAEPAGDRASSLMSINLSVQNTVTSATDDSDYETDEDEKTSEYRPLLKSKEELEKKFIEPLVTQFNTAVQTTITCCKQKIDLAKNGCCSCAGYCKKIFRTHTYKRALNRLSQIEEIRLACDNVKSTKEKAQIIINTLGRFFPGANCKLPEMFAPLKEIAQTHVVAISQQERLLQEMMKGLNHLPKKKQKSSAPKCCICWDKNKPITQCFMPCGHMQVCDECSPKFKINESACPTCRKIITAKQKIYQ